VTAPRTARAESVAHATADYLEDEILRRIKDRGWYRQHRSLGWPDWEQENRAILRTLLRIRRQARQMAEAIPPLDDEWETKKARYDAEQLADAADDLRDFGVGWVRPGLTVDQAVAAFIDRAEQAALGRSGGCE